MGISGAAYIAGAYEHPLRVIPDKSVAQVHAEVAAGALADAGLTFDDVDGYFCAGDAPGMGAIGMADYMGLKLKHTDSTETGGSSYLVHVGHAMEAIHAGKIKVALVTLAGLPRQASANLQMGVTDTPEGGFENVFGPTIHGMYALAAKRHMHEYGTTSEQLAWIRVAASTHAQYNPNAMFQNVDGTSIHGMYALAAKRHMHEYGTTSEQLAWIRVAASTHAQHNPNAMFQNVVTVDDVLSSPMISDPLHRLDCCVISDGGGAVVVVSPDVAKGLERHSVKVLGHGEAPKHADNGRIDLTYTGAAWTGPAAFEEAGLKPKDVQYASIYDSFTITVLEQIEDLGFCEKGKGGEFVADGGLISPTGRLPFNTDGGGLTNNHPVNRGGMTKILEAVRQLRGEAHPAVQVPNCEIALAHGTGGSIGTRMGSATLVLGRD